jgi:hypothetical protein
MKEFSVQKPRHYQAVVGEWTLSVAWIVDVWEAAVRTKETPWEAVVRCYDGQYAGGAVFMAIRDAMRGGLDPMEISYVLNEGGRYRVVTFEEDDLMQLSEELGE